MFFDNGQWAFPDGEAHLTNWMRVTNRRVEGRLTYQYHKYEAAVRFCRQRRRAVDVGAHVGLWSYWMARDFQHVDAFEPIPDHRECWMINMMGRRGHTTLHPMALGATVEQAAFTTEAISSGATFLDRTKARGQVLVQPLDQLALSDVDFIKVDVEGTERDVLEGGINTIRHWKPIIVVEQKGNEARQYGRPKDEAVAYLRSVGMRPLMAPLNGDWIMGW